MQQPLGVKVAWWGLKVALVLAIGVSWPATGVNAQSCGGVVECGIGSTWCTCEGSSTPPPVCYGPGSCGTGGTCVCSGNCTSGACGNCGPDMSVLCPNQLTSSACLSAECSYQGLGLCTLNSCGWGGDGSGGGGGCWGTVVWNGCGTCGNPMSRQRDYFNSCGDDYSACEGPPPYLSCGCNQQVGFRTELYVMDMGAAWNFNAMADLGDVRRLNSIFYRPQIADNFFGSNPSAVLSTGGIGISSDYWMLRFGERLANFSSDEYGRGWIYLNRPGTYTFYVTSDNGYRLKVGGTLIGSNWSSMTENSTWSGVAHTYANPSPGWRYFSFEYYEWESNASYTLEYAGPGLTRRVVGPDYTRSCYAPSRSCNVAVTAESDGVLDRVVIQGGSITSRASGSTGNDVIGRRGRIVLSRDDRSRILPTPAGCTETVSGSFYAYLCGQYDTPASGSSSVSHVFNTAGMPLGRYRYWCDFPWFAGGSTAADSCSGNPYCEYESPSPAVPAGTGISTCGASGWVSCSNSDNLSFAVVSAASPTPSPTSTPTPTITLTPTPTPWVGCTLVAAPDTGTAPLNNVSLTGNVSGTATGNIRYQFDCTNNASYELDTTVASNPYTASNLCSYATGGAYTAALRVTRQGLNAVCTANVPVNVPVCAEPVLTCTPNACVGATYSATCTWNSVSGATSYRLEWPPSASNYTGMALSYTIPNLTSGVIYNARLRVQTSNSAVCTAPSAWAPDSFSQTCAMNYSISGTVYERTVADNSCLQTIVGDVGTNAVDNGTALCITQPILGTCTNVNANGTYTVNNVPENNSGGQVVTLTNLDTTNYEVVCGPVNPFVPPGFSQSVPNTVSSPNSPGLTTFTQPISSADWVVRAVPVGVPWWQTAGGDVGANNGGDVTSELPAGELLSETLPSIASGLLTYDGGGSLTLGAGTFASPDWKAKSVYDTTSATYPKEDYGYFAQLFSVPGVVTTIGPGSIADPNLGAGDHVRYSSGGAAVDVAWDVDTASEKITVFVNGDLAINANVTVDNDSFLAFIVSGDITIDSGVTNLQGVYVADGTITTNSAGVDLDAQLMGEGMFIGWTNVTLQRDLPDDTATPAEYFRYRPDLLINAPEQFKRPVHVWREIAPVAL